MTPMERLFESARQVEPVTPEALARIERRGPPKAPGTKRRLVFVVALAGVLAVGIVVQRRSSRSEGVSAPAPFSGVAAVPTPPVRAASDARPPGFASDVASRANASGAVAKLAGARRPGGPSPLEGSGRPKRGASDEVEGSGRAGLASDEVDGTERSGVAPYVIPPQAAAPLRAAQPRGRLSEPLRGEASEVDGARTDSEPVEVAQRSGAERPPVAIAPSFRDARRSRPKGLRRTLPAYQPRAVRELVELGTQRLADRELTAEVRRILALTDRSSMLAHLDRIPIDDPDVIALRGALRVEARRCPDALDDLSRVERLAPRSPAASYASRVRRWCVAAR